jgi:Ankyrin repeats (3 copies)
LCLASANGHVRVVSLLLSDPRVDPNRARMDGVTPLIIATQQRHYDIMRRLLADARTDPNLKSLYPLRLTALLVGLRQTDEEAVRVLLSDRRVNLTKSRYELEEVEVVAERFECPQSIVDMLQWFRAHGPLDSGHVALATPQPSTRGPPTAAAPPARPLATAEEDEEEAAAIAALEAIANSLPAPTDRRAHPPPSSSSPPTALRPPTTTTTTTSTTAGSKVPAAKEAPSSTSSSSSSSSSGAASALLGDAVVARKVSMLAPATLEHWPRERLVAELVALSHRCSELEDMVQRAAGLEARARRAEDTLQTIALALVAYEGGEQHAK